MWWIPGGVLGVTVLLCITAAWVCYRLAFHVSPQVKQWDPLAATADAPEGSLRAAIHKLSTELFAVPYEEVWCTARDGCRLYGRYYHAADGAPLHIQFHGWRSAAVHDFGGGHKMARRMGHNILLVDQRAHGKSEGHTLSFGLRERYDCADWAFWAAEQFPTSPILLSGISMGAATVLMAADLPLPPQVVGIMADCPYDSPAHILEKACRDRGIPLWLGMPLVRLGAVLFGGFRLTKRGAVDAVANTTLPILLVHGEEDDFVPCDMSRRIAAACASRLFFLTVPKAGHGSSFLVDTEGYKRAVNEFLVAVLPSADHKI